MIVHCSQCGGRIDRKDENRFFTCPYCASSLVLEGDRSFICLIMEHQPNELWARAVFLERLRKAGFGKNSGTIDVSLSYLPFWLIRRRDGTVSARPAAASMHADLSSVKVPPGRLVFLEEDSRPREPLIPPTISPRAALGAESETSVGRIDLVYLPVYSMRSAGPAGEHRSMLVADSSRLYSATTPVQKRAPYLRPLLFFIAAACFFVAVGLRVDNVYVRGAAMAVGGLALILVSPLIIGRPG